jgi:hypothetical protein
MKIDFLGRYGEVQRLLEPKTGRLEDARPDPSFSEILEPTSPKVEENQPPRPPARPQPLPSPTDVMGRYQFPGPALTPPASEAAHPTPPADSPTGPVNDATRDITPPSILAVRRRGTERTLADLPREEREREVQKLVSKAGAEQGVDPALGLAVARVESSFNPNAVSRDGHATKGLFQLKDSTGKRILEQLSSPLPYKPLDPKQNVDLGVGYLRYLHDIFSAPTQLHETAATVGAANSTSLEKLAVAAFNAGEGRVAEAQRRAARAGKNPGRYEDIEAYLPETTRSYVQKVIGFKSDFTSRFIG